MVSASVVLVDTLSHGCQWCRLGGWIANHRISRKVVDQMVDTEWIAKLTYFLSHSLSKGSVGRGIQSQIAVVFACLSCS